MVVVNLPKVKKDSSGKNKKSKRKKNRSQKSRVALSPFAKLVADPCNSKLVPGLYGSTEGMLGRFINDVTVKSAYSALKFGYIVWFPTFHNDQDVSTSTQTCLNTIMWASSNASAIPALNDYGRGNTLLTAVSYPDPCYNFIKGDVCQDARTLSACLEVEYSGTTSGGQGLVGTLTNVPVSALLYGGTGNTPPSVTMMMQYCNQKTRAVDREIVKWRPKIGDASFRDDINGPIMTANSAGGITSIPSYSNDDAPTGIGFVFYNVTALSDYLITATKNIEWRPEVGSGLSQMPPTGTTSPGILNGILKSLDDNYPGWQVKMAQGSASLLVNAVAQMALGGAMPSNAIEL